MSLSASCSRVVIVVVLAVVVVVVVVVAVVVSSRSNISSSSTYEGVRLPNETLVTSLRFVICRSPPPTTPFEP